MEKTFLPSFSCFCTPDLHKCVYSFVQLLSCVQLFATPRSAACRASLFFTISQSLLKLISIESVMPSNHLIPFSSCLQSFPASGSFPMSRHFISGGQSIGASASASVLPMNIQGWLPLGLTGLISLLSEGHSRVFCLFPCELNKNTLTDVHFYMCINKNSLLDQILNRPPEPSFAIDLILGPVSIFRKNPTSV